MLFEQWVGDTAGIDDINAPGTTITMPATDVEITATYTAVTYTLTVNGGTGGGDYPAGQAAAQVPRPPTK